MADCEKVCNYIDLPLQHASDAVLKRMKRPGTRASYERLLDRIRERVPGVTLRTTFIVGFPGETEADFERACRISSKAIGFDHVGVFTYSHEEGTSAHGLDDDVPAQVKTAAAVAADEPAEAASSRKPSMRVGEQVRLMVDGPSPDHELVLRARLEGQAPDIDPVVFLTDCDPSEFTRRPFYPGRDRRQPRIRPLACPLS